MPTYRSMELDYVAHNVVGQTGSAVKDRRTELVITAYNILFPVEKDVYRATSPSGKSVATSTITSVNHIFIQPVKWGYWMLAVLSDVNDWLSVAVKYAYGNAVLCTCVRGTITVPKPYWADVETNGVDASIDTYPAYKLSEGQYALFWEKGTDKPSLGSLKIAFKDVYPKEKLEKATVQLDLAKICGATKFGKVNVSTGIGQEIVGYSTLYFCATQYVMGDDPRTNFLPSLACITLWRAPLVSYNPVCHSDGYYVACTSPYLDDLNATTGTWQDRYDGFGDVYVVDDAYWGYVIHISQHRLDHSRVNAGRVINLMYIDAPASRVRTKVGHYVKPVLRHYNYGTAGVCPPFSIRALARDTDETANIDLFDGTSWISTAMSTGAYTRVSNRYACHHAPSPTEGTWYRFMKLVEMITNDPSITTYTPRFYCWDRRDIGLHQAETEDRYLEVGYVYGMVGEGCMGLRDYKEPTPTSPASKTTTKTIDDYFTDPIDPPTAPAPAPAPVVIPWLIFVVIALIILGITIPLFLLRR